MNKIFLLILSLPTGFLVGFYYKHRAPITIDWGADILIGILLLTLYSWVWLVFTLLKELGEAKDKYKEKENDLHS